MIKRQYRLWGQRGYFQNFVNSLDSSESIHDALQPYRATLAKSKNENNIFNVKWHDEGLYMWFIMKWA